ncbi:D-Ala-D-Ala carboxypeptidase family metallohydrolase [Micromonospora sp. ALFpr18c]|uniref:D-Ala-D-Ala carboxypeptidase family metallohydrolase n=1 Tax=unclassified Micromonospora TaxID=2617518 RepID=UPI001CED4997|nr:D-Ala-D-Ala carboxypeptidase family metallohydrolase [Micromonospora sp. ALFpr18c]
MPPLSVSRCAPVTSRSYGAARAGRDSAVGKLLATRVDGLLVDHENCGGRRHDPTARHVSSRHACGDVPITISSSFRSYACSSAVGGASNSRHLHGAAWT